MKLLKCKNGAILMHDGETGAYWVVASICGKSARLFAGATPEKAFNTFNYYSRINNDCADGALIGCAQYRVAARGILAELENLAGKGSAA